MSKFAGLISIALLVGCAAPTISSEAGGDVLPADVFVDDGSEVEKIRLVQFGLLADDLPAMCKGTLGIKVSPTIISDNIYLGVPANVAGAFVRLPEYKLYKDSGDLHIYYDISVHIGGERLPAPAFALAEVFDGKSWGRWRSERLGGFVGFERGASSSSIINEKVRRVLSAMYFKRAGSAFQRQALIAFADGQIANPKRSIALSIAAPSELSDWYVPQVEMPGHLSKSFDYGKVELFSLPSDAFYIVFSDLNRKSIAFFSPDLMPAFHFDCVKD